MHKHEPVMICMPPVSPLAIEAFLFLLHLECTLLTLGALYSRWPSHKVAMHVRALHGLLPTCYVGEAHSAIKLTKEKYFPLVCYSHQLSAASESMERIITP